MSQASRFVPKVSRRTLLAIAGVIWSFAGIKVTSMGIAGVVGSPVPLWIRIVGAVAVGWLFIRYIFGPLYFRHRLRIMLSEPEPAPIHRFFDRRSYLIAVLMMGFGILLRRTGIVDPRHLAIFYMGLGPALLMGGLFFLKGAVVYDRVMEKITSDGFADDGSKESLPHGRRKKGAPHVDAH